MKERKRGVVNIRATEPPAAFVEVFGDVTIINVQVDVSTEAAQAELDRIAALCADGLPEWPGLANEMRAEFRKLRRALTGSPMPLPAVILSAIELGRLEWELAANRQLLKPQEQYLALCEHGRTIGQDRKGKTRLDYVAIETEAKRLLAIGKQPQNLTTILVNQGRGEETAIRASLREKGIIPQKKRKPRKKRKPV